MKEDKKLNVGCGRNIKSNWVNLDKNKFEGVDVVHDLNVYPYPFKDNTFDKIFGAQIIEHLDHPEKFICELWRIAKPGAKVTLATVHFSAPTVWGDITHKRPYQSDTLNYFNIKYKERRDLSLENQEGIYFKVRSEIAFGRFFKYLTPLVNKNRYFQLIYERFFSAFFRADGQNYYLEVVKE